jgi:hypothetical protein
MIKMLDFKDQEVRQAWANIIGSADWGVIERSLQGTLRQAYRDACAGAEPKNRDWFAGRASVVQEFLDDVDNYREQLRGNRAPRVVIQNATMKRGIGF